MKKLALVTGGNSGIGYATAALLKDKGYDVYIAGRNEIELTKASKVLGVNYIVCDISSSEDIAKLLPYFFETGLDALINNAAIARFLPLELHSDEDYQDFMNTNIIGTLKLIQTLLPALEKRSGCVTSVSSIVTNNGLLNASLYAATKGAMDAYTKSLSLELASKNIRINVVAPGAIDTPILNKLGIDEATIKAIRDQQEEVIPMRRYGKPEEVAQVIYSQIESTYVTGAVWNVDGGMDAV